MVNGTPGFVVMRGGAPFSVLGFTVRGGRIVELDVVADPDRLQRLDLSVLDD
jgi:RNA polymerase sigma-70 factor (ECF subfamily)